MNRKRAPDVYVIADNVLSPIGDTTAENFHNLRHNVTAVKQHTNPGLSGTPFYAALFDGGRAFLTGGDGELSRFEQLCVTSVTAALKSSGIDAADAKTALIFSSTKGNVSLLENKVPGPELKKRISLFTSAKLVADHFGFVNPPIVISNACISGVMALITGMRLLRSGRYAHTVIAGADEVSKFIVSGFQSFNALSPGLCRPFDTDRDGLNLGEGAATIILSTEEPAAGNIKLKGGSVSNDANHISGPSRTGKELGFAIDQAIADAQLLACDIDFIAAHGTATIYNDEMEASAITLAGLQAVPLNSLKGYYGHTLGAAGLIESAIALESLRQEAMIPTFGFKSLGVSSCVNVCAAATKLKSDNFLKTASGFGGCNGAVVFGK